MKTPDLEKILLVDDTPINLKILTRILGPVGYNLSFATSGQQALDLTLKLKPDLILLDIMMPDMDGFTVCQRLKAAAETKHIPVIFVTAQEDMDSLTQAFAAGGIDYIRKPANQAEVLARVQTHLLLRRQQLLLEQQTHAAEHRKKEAEQATQLKDKFVSLVAHDLRGPLSEILASLEIMNNESVHQDLVDGMIKICHQQLNMINEILDLARLKTGKIVPRFEFIDASFLVGSVLETITVMMRKKSIEVINEIPEGMRIYADMHLLQEVLRNIIHNAIKFSHLNSQIRISFIPGQPVQIVIEDHGLGMSEGALAKVFRVEEKTSTIGTMGELGTGFGLPYSREIMLAHQGDIVIQSAPGVGSSFFVQLPYIQPEILLVDDDAEFRLVFIELMATFAVKVTVVNSGAQALSTVQNQGFHLIVLDLSLPDMAGLQVLKQLKKMPTVQDTPVVLLSAEDHDDISTEYFNFGADDFIRKPIQPSDILRIQQFIK